MARPNMMVGPSAGSHLCIVVISAICGILDETFKGLSCGAVSELSSDTEEEETTDAGCFVCPRHVIFDIVSSSHQCCLHESLKATDWKNYAGGY
jgi:hypothetical protein